MTHPVNFKMNFSAKIIAVLSCLIAISSTHTEEALTIDRGFNLPTIDIQAQKTTPLPVEKTTKIDAPAFGATEQTDYTTTQNNVPRVKIKEWGEEFDPIKDVYGQVAKDRADLKALREKQIAIFNAEAAKENPNYFGLTSGITTDMIAYINNIIDETVKKMGPAPTRFNIFTMGSMARDEAGFFTDLEIGILVAQKTPEVVQYFKKFAQLLSDRFFLLGEHPDVGGKGLRIDEADNAPLHLKWFARFASNKQTDELLDEALRKRKFDKIPFEGSRIFLATPQEFAEYVNPKILNEKTLKEAKKEYLARIEALTEIAWQEKAKELDLSNMSDAQRASARADIRRQVKEKFDVILKPLSRKEYKTAKSLQTLVRNIRPLYGDKELFDEYLKAREVYLQGPPEKPNPHYKVTRRQELAYDKDVEELSKPLAHFDSPIRGTIGDAVDLKRELYRFPEQVITNRGFWYGLPVQNQADILQELVKRGLFNPNLAARVHDAINFITGLRLKEQAILRKQGFAIPASPEEWEDIQQDLKEDIINLENVRDNYIAFKIPQDDINKVNDKITKAKSQLLNLQKMKPLNIGSILTAEEIAELNEKHLPVLKDLYDANIDFLKGNEQAFMREPTPLKTEANKASTASEEDKQEFVMPRVKTTEWGEKFEPLKQLYGQAVADRENLANMREEHIVRFQAEETKENPDYLALTPAITEATINYINNIVDQTIKKIGPPPTKFSLFTMGSMARDESGFYTDLEIGILVDKKDAEVKKYFDKLAQVLSDRFYLLGEHPAVGGKGLRIDEADNAPLHMRWFARYASPTRIQELKDLSLRLRNKNLTPGEGSRIFLATPEEFAEYLDPNILNIIEAQKEPYKQTIQTYVDEAWQQELKKPESDRRTREQVVQEIHDTYDGLLKPISGREKAVLASLPSLARNTRHLFGDESIFDRYIRERNRYLDGPPAVSNPNYATRREEIATNELLTNIIKDIADPSALVHGKMGKDIDIKRKLYRWPEQTMTNLNFWYNLNTRSSEQTLQELENRGLFDPGFAKKLRSLMNFATGLRLKEQEVLRKQGKMVPLTQEEWAENKADLEEELAYLRNLEAFLTAANRPVEERDAAYDKIIEVQNQLKDIGQLKPLEPYSIIKAEDVKLLETKYLPILNELFQRTRAFVEGDKNAFIDSAQEFSKKHPNTTPVITTPAEGKSESISQAKPSEPEQLPTPASVAAQQNEVQLPFASLLDQETLARYRKQADRGFVRNLNKTAQVWAQIQEAAKAGNVDAKSILKNAAGVK